MFHKVSTIIKNRLNKNRGRLLQVHGARYWANLSAQLRHAGRSVQKQATRLLAK